MIKKDITYKNYEDVKVTETFYFHLSKTELMEMMVAHDGGLEEYIKRIGESNDNKRVYEEFKKILLMSVGRRPLEGNRFIKTEDIRQDFQNSDAMGELIIELLSDEVKAAEFINSLLPKELRNEVGKAVDLEPVAAEDPEATSFDQFAPRRLTPIEIQEMDADELRSGLATGRYEIASVPRPE